MKILYLAPKRGTAAHRGKAMQRLGHELHWIDPYDTISKDRLTSKYIRWTGGVGLWSYVGRQIFKQIHQTYDVVFINGGSLLGPKVVQQLKAISHKVVCYNNDDPFGGRDIQTWLALQKSIPFYNLLVFPRLVNVEEAKRVGATKAIRAWFTADEIEHAYTEGQQRSKIVFVGTWFPGRDLFMQELLKDNVPLEIFGNSWEHAPLWPSIKNNHFGAGIEGQNYRNTLGGGTVCLGLLSKENRDLHTTRSIEIPAMGGLLLAERTQEHLELFKDGEEAVFWDSPQECAEKSKWLLEHPETARHIALAGHCKVKKLGLYNENFITQILTEAFL